MIRTDFLKSVLILFAVVGCSKPDSPDVPHVTPTDPSTDSPYFKADVKDVYLLGPDDTGFTLVVDTNMDSSEWSVTGDAAWIKITRNGKEVIIVPDKIERDQSYYPAPRTCCISVKGGNLFDKKLAVVQEAWTRIRSEYQVKLKASGESVEVCVEHNCYGWTPQTEADWLTVKKKDSATLTITSTSRDEAASQPRSAVVRLQSDMQPDIYWNITVSDADPDLVNEDFEYGDHTEWD